jgi:cytochrome c peroxidase
MTPFRVALVAAFLSLVAALTAVTFRVVRHTPPAISGPMSREDARVRARALAALGAQMFSDVSLSASGRMSCASCHDPARAFAPANARAVQMGGADLSRAGHRAVPSLKYLQAVPPFTEHFFEAESDGDSSVDNGPTGGLTWDGRVDRASAQSRFPLFAPFEMANASAADLTARAARAPYAQQLRWLFGDAILDDPDTALDAIGQALEAFQQDPAAFYPYDSKYDAYLDGRATLAPEEQRGLAAFDDPARGNCASCHLSRRAPDGAAPQFTDYGLIALGVPRNATIPANADPAYFDLGLCGPDRTTKDTQLPEYCGRFMTPTLRNVATRSSFFHNGVFHDLRTAVGFYADRDAHPEKFYPRGPDGRVRKFDDLPEMYWRNVESGAPFDRTRLTPQDVDDIVAFLKTLTDGYKAR